VAEENEVRGVGWTSEYRRWGLRESHGVRVGGN